MRWSQVRAAANVAADRPHEALAQLLLCYWYPIYAHVRCSGHAPDIAQDIARAFFQHATTARPGAGLTRYRCFRDWLLYSLDAFLGGEWHALAGADTGVLSPSLQSLERRHRADAGAASPVEAFQRGFANELMARGMAALERETRAAGHARLHAALEPWLEHDPAPGQLERTAAALGLRPLALTLALARLRERFRTLVRAEIAATVAAVEDIPAEQRALRAILHGQRA